MKRTLRTLVLVAALATPFGAKAQAPAVHGSLLFEHLVIAGGGERSLSVPGGVADLALGLPLGSSGVLANVGLRAGVGEEDDRIAPHLFMRVLGGDERWKTFFDVGLLGRVKPSWSAGPRMGIGVQRELGPHLGIYAMAGGAVGFGDRFHVGFDGGIGLQLRFGTTSSVRYDYVH